MKIPAVIKLVVGITTLSLVPTTQALPSWLSAGLKRDANPVAAADNAVYSAASSAPAAYGVVQNGGEDARVTTTVPSAFVTHSPAVFGDPSLLVNGIIISGGGTTASEFLVTSAVTSSDVDSTTTIFVTSTSTITRTTTPGVYGGSALPLAVSSSVTPSDGLSISGQKISVTSSSSVLSAANTADGATGTNVVSITSSQRLSSVSQLSAHESSVTLSSSGNSSLAASVSNQTISTNHTHVLVSFSPEPTTISTYDVAGASSLAKINAISSQRPSSLSPVSSKGNSTTVASATLVALSSSVSRTGSLTFLNSSSAHATAFSSSTVTHSASGNVSATRTNSRSRVTRFSSPTAIRTGSGLVSTAHNSSTISTSHGAAHLARPSNSTSVYSVIKTISGSALSINASTLVGASRTTRRTVHSSFASRAGGSGFPTSSSVLYRNTTTAVPVPTLFSVTTDSSATVSVLNSSFTALSTADGFSKSFASLKSTGSGSSEGSSSSASIPDHFITIAPSEPTNLLITPITTINPTASGLSSDIVFLPTSVGPVGSVVTTSGLIVDDCSLTTIGSTFLTSNPVIHGHSPSASIGPVVPSASSAVGKFLSSSFRTLKSSSAGTPPFSNSTGVPTLRPSTTMTIGNMTIRVNGTSNSTALNNSSSTRTTSAVSFRLPTVTSLSIFNPTTIATPTPYYQPQHVGYRKHRPHHYSDDDDEEEGQEEYGHHGKDKIYGDGSHGEDEDQHQ